MNGFVNTLLSVALSWIKALISNLWVVLNSEDGGAFYRFLSANWLSLVIVICVVCLLVDAVVYFFRWRPDYVWASKWRRLRRRKRSEAYDEPYAEPMPPQEAFYAYQPPEPEAAAPTAAYAPLQPVTTVYAPVSQPTQVWQPLVPEEELQDLVFDDALWDEPEETEEAWQSEPQPAFGAPRPEPLAYFRDVQAGFAPAVPPEQLYAPAVSSQPETENNSVHPGLDEEAVRMSMGLKQNPSHLHSPAFRPFTVTHETELPVQQTAFQRFAQRARDFMVMDDGERKTIRDLQSNVDVSKAFHEPVYPQPYDRSKE